MAKFNIITGDCLGVMATMEPNSVDAVVTDPPYGLSFMGKDWDRGVPGAPFWTEASRVAKPGSMLLAFGGTRTFHRLTCAIEDAGWTVRDCMAWLYGSGFPKSADISKAIDREAGAEREKTGPMSFADGTKQRRTGGAGISGNQKGQAEGSIPATPDAETWDGYGTAMKPAYEPIILAMKPLEGTFAQNALKWGVAGLWIDGGRIGTDEGDRKRPESSPGRVTTMKNPDEYDPSGKGRWPANIILDEEAAEMLDRQSGDKSTGKPHISHTKALRQSVAKGKEAPRATRHPGGSGGASRYFKVLENDLRFHYTSKASVSERESGLEPSEDRANLHPTVKPIALMQYLCRLVRMPTPGMILDPFCGSGSTGIAALREGFDFIGIELDPNHAETARKRIGNDAPLFNCA